MSTFVKAFQKLKVACKTGIAWINTNSRSRLTTNYFHMYMQNALALTHYGYFYAILSCNHMLHYSMSATRSWCPKPLCYESDVSKQINLIAHSASTRLLVFGATDTWQLEMRPAINYVIFCAARSALLVYFWRCGWTFTGRIFPYDCGWQSHDNMGPHVRDVPPDVFMLTKHFC